MPERQPLNPREEEILNFIKEEVLKKGYPPSVRDIGPAVGLRSSSTIHGYLTSLEYKGYIRRDPTKPRAIELLDRHAPEVVSPVPASQLIDDENLVEVPILGQVAAGVPLLAEENWDNKMVLPRDFTGYGKVFMLTVKGDSMIEAGIHEGDLVLVRQQPNANNGDIVVALIEDEATVKRYYKERDHVRLQPENSRLEPIIVRDVKIAGKVLGLIDKEDVKISIRRGEI